MLRGRQERIRIAETFPLWIAPASVKHYARTGYLYHLAGKLGDAIGRARQRGVANVAEANRIYAEFELDMVRAPV